MLNVALTTVCRQHTSQCQPDGADLSGRLIVSINNLHMFRSMQLYVFLNIYLFLLWNNSYFFFKLQLQKFKNRKINLRFLNSLKIELLRKEKYILCYLIITSTTEKGYIICFSQFFKFIAVGMGVVWVVHVKLSVFCLSEFY